MKHLITLPLTTATLLVLASAASAQNLRFNGLLNEPLGGASLSESANGTLLVSNLGSSGLDGVRVELGESQGTQISPVMALPNGGSCAIEGELGQFGPGSNSQVGLYITYDPATGETVYAADFTGIGQQTYDIRAYRQGQLVYEEDDTPGPLRLSNVPIVLPEKVYLFLPDWVGGPNYPAFCGFTDGVITPPGGNPIPIDLVEFIAQPVDVTTVESISVRGTGAAKLEITTEELRVFGLQATGVDDVHLDTPDGKLKVSNLGSSGCDGVSIAMPDDTAELTAEAQELSAPNNSGGLITLEAFHADGSSDRLRCISQNGQWRWAPDFSAYGNGSFTLELYLGGQLVFEQSGMTGEAVASAAFRLFYKKTTTYPDGTTTTEWCIGSSTASAHAVPNGPTVQADMFTVRSENVTVTDDDVQRLVVRGAGMPTEIEILSMSAAPAASCIGTNYCQTSPNSAGAGAIMCSSGSSSVAANDLLLICTGLPANQFGIFYYGPNQIQAPFGNGFRCVGGTTNRLPITSSGASGTLTHALDNTSPPSASGQISAGQLWNFQAWYRDPAGGGSSYNLSDGHAVTFLP